MVTYLGTRNVAMFSCDIDSQDYKHDAMPEKIVNNVMTRLAKLGKGIVLGFPRGERADERNAHRLLPRAIPMSLITSFDLWSSTLTPVSLLGCPARDVRPASESLPGR